jgi:hypothetical protein
LAACLLAVLVTAPMFDAVVCFNDEAPAAAMVSVDAASAEISAQPAREHGPGHPADAASDCQHGHCHHGALILSALIGDEAAPDAAQSPQPALSARAAPSQAVAGPDRPPRA